MISLASYPTRNKSLIDDQLYGQIDKAVSRKPTRKVTTTPISLNRKIAPQTSQQYDISVETQLPTADIVEYESIEYDEKEISKLDESIAESTPDDFVEGHSPNIAARSAMFEFLSDNMGSLQSDTVSAESSKLRSFERLTSEVLKESVADVPLIAILKTNGWTGSRFRSTPTTALNPNALFLAFLNLHMSRKASKDHLKQMSSRDGLRNIISRDGGSVRIDSSGRHSGLTRNRRESISNVKINDAITEEDLYYEQIQSFCPNILLSHLS
jgi:hypothetical protein